MKNPIGLEEAFREFAQHLSFFLPDGIIDVDLKLLHEHNVLSQKEEEETEDIKYYFHIIETSEKITLFNDDFVVWIVPQNMHGTSSTLTLVARIIDKKVQSELELGFRSDGVYNSSHIVLQVLEHFLEEIRENDKLLSSLNQDPSNGN